MSLKLLRQILKACADDKRLRIISILKDKELTVKEICSFINVSQPTVSKHLMRLRLLRIVVDKRVGNSVYYCLNGNPGTPQNKVVSFIVSQFSDTVTFQRDKEELEKVKSQKI